ncbi:AMP-binding protein [Actinomadura madurae]|uniref:AMP-binding protein n=1 Tax=Actinomadura madurae TaxID=1993 RepID=UPI0020D25523|nr:AMP-binding protein [Actinomadura madurae]MCP9967946.1 AMP-binding protein [Actinomadura madurae]MCP9980407.1 AMP-binding protein [Actinomadura madurae]MCQ0008078.1 AMP-binding protein [Actinomadura madurae]MCQ0016608.1 AMP-binding protein [Actinomadura madurae]
MTRWRSLYGEGVPGEIEVEGGSVVELFRRRAAERPDAPQLHYFGATLDRAGTDRLSDALAAGMEKRGVGSGDRVAVSLQNTPVCVLAVLAAWKLGATVVPVNPMYRERELAHLLADSGARVLIAHPDARATIEALASGPEHVLYSAGGALAGDATGPWPDEAADDVLPLLEAGGAPQAAVAPGPDDPALLSYTSGTTGPAKGAVNTHRNLAYQVAACRTWIGLGDGDAILTIAPLFHITGLAMHLALGLGGGLPLVLTYRFDAATTSALVERHRPTFTIGSITAFIAFLNDPATRDRGLASLTKVLSGGAPVPSATVRAFADAFGVYIHNAYGLTETTSAAVAVPVGATAPVDEASGVLAIGVPFPSAHVEIRDEKGGPLPPGEIGELAITGPQVAAGYWRNPEQTRASFPAGTLLTGDVGFMDEAGWIYLVDRKKDMIVASGFKIWPREVEDVLYEHPSVREAAVVGAPDPYRGETVHAFVSLRPGTATTPDDLRAFCRDRLAAYKIPAQVEIKHDLPKSVTGKILRRQLRT